ncbi:MAG TPA: Asp-tRNA(Asn)/Glu-tRNA(Gln) amidotransferase subunit GatB, partial [Polyangia bacterium]|nr:Asp-tRNA(Asn)/Glu-tRNA(Gln) amidotransferase subunit GatB [Polyangia bacterium]
MSVSNYEVVIGLEVHVQLATKSKIFSWSSAAFGAEPNTHTDPVCLGLPGTLPVLNRAAVDSAVRLGLAAGCTIRTRCRFARKHFFYADLPKGFQISQFDEPICDGGAIKFRLHGELRTVALTRIHLEEDTGKNIHAAAGVSFVDYNRAGVPLCEIVSEPDIRSAEEAAEYVRAVRSLVRYLGIGDGNMEEGSLRCDANVSLRLAGAAAYGTKAEIKNMNSFKNVRDAIEHEVKRQASLLDRGERVAQETRLWDPARGVTQSMRSKESAHDYRYFPEPDLPPLVVTEAELAAFRESLPELPEDRFARYTGPVGLSPQDAGVLVADHEIAAYFDAVVSAGAPPKRAANWVINEVLARAADPRQLGGADLPVPPPALAELVKLVEDGTLSGKLAKDVFTRMWTERRT